MLLLVSCPDGQPRALRGSTQAQVHLAMSNLYRRLAPLVLTIAMGALALGFATVTLVA